MKILHLCSNDTKGGAARAAYRLHTALRANNIDSWMLVLKKNSKDPYVIGRTSYIWKLTAFAYRQVEKMQVRIYPNRRKEIFSVGNISSMNVGKKVREINPDIIHLHWINGSFINYKQLAQLGRLNKKIVWTLHDSWPFTGGCHIPHSCERYKEKCGNCPILNSGKENDLSRRIWLKKEETYKDLDLTIVTPSTWMKKCAEESSLLGDRRVVCIPNSIDTEEYKVLDKNKARKSLGLSQDKKYLLFGAMSATRDRNKGFDLSVAALKYLKDSNVELLVFGNDEGSVPKLNIPVKYFGRIRNSKKLNQLYSAADVMVIPSRSENFPNTVLESFACGTPCVSFDIGGFPDMIEHRASGYLAKHFDTRDLANGIQYCLIKDDLGIKGREKVLREYSLEVQAKRYVEFYKSLQ